MEEVEQIRITHDPLDLDAMTKLWSMLQAPYRPSMAYRVSVALIGARSGGAVAPPVRRPWR